MQCFYHPEKEAIAGCIRCEQLICSDCKIVVDSKTYCKPCLAKVQDIQEARFNTLSLDLRRAECPYCHSQLKKIPGSKTKCPHCGKYMRVKTRPSDLARIVVTEEESEKIDEQWAIAQGRHDIYLSEKQRKATDKQDRETVRQTLINRFGKEPSKGDIEWGFLNRKLEDAIKRGDWSEIGSISREQALLLEREGRESTRLRQESVKAFKKAMRNVLLHYQESGVVDKVEILAAGENSCPACMALDGRIYTTKQALEENPLPVANCTGGYGYCRCCYLPVVD